MNRFCAMLQKRMENLLNFDTYHHQVGSSELTLEISREVRFSVGKVTMRRCDSEKSGRNCNIEYIFPERNIVTGVEI